MSEDRNAKANALAGELRREGAGRLTVFLGAAPGVGKTYAMLSRARELRKQGVDVVVGIVETHGRGETAALVEGLEVLPRKRIDYVPATGGTGRTLEEMDIDALLARRPDIALVDELAHRNVPGSRHERRWQDVAELLDAGIDVYTTVNIQHLESLNDIVHRITGVRVAETVPDAVFDRLRDIRLVDLPPRELIERLNQGKVYLPEQAERLPVPDVEVGPMASEQISAGQEIKLIVDMGDGVPPCDHARSHRDEDDQKNGWRGRAQQGLVGPLPNAARQ